MGVAVAFDVTFERCVCSDCGIVYFVPDWWRQTRRIDHKAFCCPNGHGQHFPTETATEKLQKELERERQKTATALHTARMEREAREKVERKLKRVDKGTCPHCNRHFVNVEKHMRSKHAA